MTARAHLVVAGGLLAALVASACTHKPAPPPPPSRGVLGHLDADRLAFGAYGRKGDLTLEDDGPPGPGGVLTFGAAPDLPGHRPLKGALIDVGVRGGGDVSDPLLWWRPGWRTKDGVVHTGPMATVDEAACPEARGVKLHGVLDGVTLDTTVCPSSDGFRATTTALGLPDGATLVDEANAGTSHVLVQGGATRIDGDADSPFFGVTNDTLGFILESPQLHVIGKVARIGEAAFQGPFVLQYKGVRALRTIRVIKGDAFDLLHEIVQSPLKVHVALGGDLIPGEAGQVALLDGAGKTLAIAPFPATGRDLVIPTGVGADLAIYDATGVLAARAPIASTLTSLVAKPPARATVSFRYTDAGGLPVPVHVLFRGLEATKDPTPTLPAASARPDVFAAGRSLYLVNGVGAVTLPPGHYRVTATHGIRYTLAVSEVTVKDGEVREVTGSLRDVLGSAPWTSGDFHLHAAPSPDAPVPLDARVAALVCEGLDLAVATDHNRVTDYGPSVERLGVGARLVTLPGDEVTSYGGAQWGHFNLYPLPVATGAPEESASPYFDLLPEKIFAAAHAGGAPGERILQVNHPRMEPSIGYFDLTHLDPKTGAADPSFSTQFDAVEAFNGFWMTNVAKVRQGATDLVTLARRGLRVAATGNSDSHHLLYDEAGYPRTYVHVAPDPITSRATRVLDAVRRGDTTLSSGPLVEMTVDGRPIGSVVVPKGGTVRVHIRVTAPAWVPVEHVEVWHDDEVVFKEEILKAPVDGVRYEADTTLPFVADGTLLTWVAAETPLPDVLPYATARAIGFTGLVYVDANGDGKVDVPPKK